MPEPRRTHRSNQLVALTASGARSPYRHPRNVRAPRATMRAALSGSMFAAHAFGGYPNLAAKLPAPGPPPHASSPAQLFRLSGPEPSSARLLLTSRLIQDSLVQRDVPLGHRRLGKVLRDPPLPCLAEPPPQLGLVSQRR